MRRLAMIVLVPLGLAASFAGPPDPAKDVIVPPPLPGAVAAPKKPAPAPAAVHQVPLIELLHRNARLRDGRLDPDAALALADAAVVRLTGRELPLDAWAALRGTGGTVTIESIPEAGPLAEAVRSRMALVAPAPGAVVTLDSSSKPTKPAGRRIVIWKPEWQGGVVAPPLPPASPGSPPPVLVLVDLFDTAIDGKPWHADAMFATREPRLAEFAAAYALGARAAGAIPDATELAASRGVNLDRVDWQRVALD